jgi:hypothetical protein
MGQPTPDELHREAINRAARARIDQIKKQLFHWMRQNLSPADGMPVTVALLEIAIEGHLVIAENGSETLDLITMIFQRLAHKPAGRVQ